MIIKGFEPAIDDSLGDRLAAGAAHGTGPAANGNGIVSAWWHRLAAVEAVSIIWRQMVLRFAHHPVRPCVISSPDRDPMGAKFVVCTQVPPEKHPLRPRPNQRLRRKRHIIDAQRYIAKRTSYHVDEIFSGAHVDRYLVDFFDACIRSFEVPPGMPGKPTACFN